MSYIVLDFEFNQAFDFKQGVAGEPNPNCRFEIIQIGALKLNNNLEIIDKCNFLIKPQLYPNIHPYVKKITNITTEMLETERPFTEVYKDFYKFCTSDNLDSTNLDNKNLNDENIVLCVWGTSDIRALYRNLAYYNLAKTPMIIKYIDVQSLATSYLKYSRGSSIGLKNAVELLNLTADEEKFHDAFYDAYYTAKVFQIVKPEKVPLKIFNSSHIITKKKNIQIEKLRVRKKK